MCEKSHIFLKQIIVLNNNKCMVVKENKNLNDSERLDIWNILVETDNEFVPPLSSRSGTTQSNLNDVESVGVPEDYFDALMEQYFVYIVEGGHIVAFLSYRRDHHVTYDGLDLTGDYISTVATTKACRNKGYLQLLYKSLFNARDGHKFITRTWSTNDSHIHVLEKLGFKLIDRIKNDRGEGVDTVIYLKEE